MNRIKNIVVQSQQWFLIAMTSTVRTISDGSVSTDELSTTSFTCFYVLNMLFWTIGFALFTVIRFEFEESISIRGFMIWHDPKILCISL